MSIGKIKKYCRDVIGVQLSRGLIQKLVEKVSESLADPYLFTVFKISPSRGSKVLIETLGEEFDGTIGCDYFSAYHKFMRLDENVKLQFCIAHLIRDIATNTRAKRRSAVLWNASVTTLSGTRRSSNPKRSTPPTWPSDSIRTLRTISGSSAIRTLVPRTTWRNRRFGL